jgi:CRISPR/Cas system-associated exonuclease Cas4 (RecB family)
MNINHISVSRKKCHDTCEQQYKYRYHLKLASPVPEPFYFTYGTIVHKIAELYVENKGQKPIGELALEITRGKIPIEDDKLCPPIPDDYKKKMTKHLRAIQNLNDRIGWDGIVEWQFNYDLDPPNKRCVTGFIDRLILKGEDGKPVDGVEKKAAKAFIIDYKTTKKGKWRVNAETVKEDLQLRMYARVVQREFGVSPDNIKAALYYLEGENLIAAQYNEESLLAVEKELKDSFIRIENADPDKVWGRVGWHCQNCDYATICPFYKGNGSGNEPKWDGNLDNLGHSGWGN